MTQKRNAPRWMRTFAALVAVMLVAAACGGGDSGTEPAEPGKASGELTVWAMGVEGENLQAIADDFVKDNPGVEVNVTPIDWEVAHQKLLTSVAGNQTPDVSLMGTTWMGEFAEMGAIAETPESFSEDQFFANSWNTTEFEGTSYGVPWYIDTRALYYRTDIAKKAGFDGPPATWDELKQMAAAMQSKGGSKYGVYLSNFNWQELLPFVWQNGGEVLSEDGQFTFDSPEVVEAIEYEKSFFEEGLTPESVPEGFDVHQPFVDGEIPMFFSGPWSVAAIQDLGGKDIEGKWSVAPMPEQDSGTSFVGGGDLVVFNQSDNQETAWTFIDYLSQPEVQSRFYELTGDLPAVEDAWELGQLENDEDRQVFEAQMEDAQVPPVVPKWEEVAAAIAEELEKALAGGASAQETAGEMQQKAESIGTGQ